MAGDFLLLLLDSSALAANVSIRNMLVSLDKSKKLAHLNQGGETCLNSLVLRVQRLDERPEPDVHILSVEESIIACIAEDFQL